MPQWFQDFLTFPFLRNGCIAALLAAVAAGVVGSLVVVRRSTYLAGAVSHSVLAGIGLSLFLTRRFGCPFLPPMAGAVLVAVGVAVLLAFLTRNGKFRADTVLSAVWTSGMALGVLFVCATPGFQDDLMGYLFGSLLLVPTEDVWRIAVMDGLVLVVTLFCYQRFLAISFNEELARLRGIRTERYELIYQILVALTVVMLIRVAGIVLAVALLTLPAATSGLLMKRLSGMMIFAVVIGGVCSLGGLVLSYLFDTPPGATIVLLAAVLYFVVAWFQRRR